MSKEKTAFLIQISKKLGFGSPMWLF